MAGHGKQRRTGPRSKKYQVQMWKKTHPYGRMADCHRDTGISLPTIRKYWWQAEVTGVRELI